MFFFFCVGKELWLALSMVECCGTSQIIVEIYWNIQVQKHVFVRCKRYIKDTI